MFCYLAGRLSLKGDRVVEGIAPGAPAHIEPCGGGQDPGVEGGEGGGRLARVSPAPAPHAVRSLVSQVLSELLVEPGGVHQPLSVGVKPLVALVEAGVHLGPVEVLGHPGGAGDDGRPLVRSVRVLLHVLGKVSLLQWSIGVTMNCRGSRRGRGGRGGCVGMSRQSVFIINITNIVNTVITGTIVAGPQCDGKNVKVFKL